MQNHSNNLAFFIENYLAGGSDKIVHDLVHNLKYNNLYLFVNKHSDLKMLMNNKVLPKNVKIIKYNIITLQELGEQANRFKIKSKIIYFFFKIFNLVIRYPLMGMYIVYFYCIFRKISIDIFFSNNGGYPGGECNRMATIAFGFVNKKCNYHIIHNLATKPFFKLFTPIEYMIDWMLDRNCTFLCVSNQTKNFLLKNRNIKQDPIVIYNGVNGNNKLIHKLNDDRIKLLNVGLLGKRKNQLLIIEALHALDQLGYKDIELYILGDEEDIGYRSMLFKKIKEYGLKNIYFEGFCDPNSYYEKCDIFILSSHIESFALARVEAMSFSMPVLTTDVGDAYMQVEDGKSGYIIQDKKQLADALQRYLDDPNLIRLHGARGYEIYNERFTINKMINNYQKLVDKGSII